MSAYSDIALPLQTVVSHAIAVMAMTLIGFTVLIYDHILTFASEVQLIWRARIGLVSVIFLLNRYIVPVMLAIDIWELQSPIPASVLFCRAWTLAQSYLTVFSFMSIHAIVAMRVYALHNGRKWVGRLLWIAGTIYFLTTLTLVTYSAIPVISHMKPVPHGCVGDIPSYLWVVWFPSVVFETLLFGLTISALLYYEREKSISTLTVILIRDGMLYFVAVAFCSTFSLLVWAMAPMTLIGLARYFALAMVNVAGSRLILNLKAYAAAKKAEREKFASSDFPYPEIAFASWPQPPPSPAFHDLRSEPSAAPTNTSSRSSAESSFDLEMYTIERECQQIGTRLH